MNARSVTYAFSVVLVLFAVNAHAQEAAALVATATAVKTAVAAAINDANITVCLPKSQVNTSQGQPLAAGVIQACTGSATANEQINGQLPGIRADNQVLIYIANGQAILGASNVTDISISIHGKSVKCDSTTDFTLAQSFYLPCWLKSADFPDASQGDTIDFAITETGAPKIYHRYARFVKTLSVIGNASGFWIPVGMFGTNFKSNSDGITLAALPIGIAWGGQDNFSGTDYIGLSAMVSWTIAPQKASDGTNSGNYTLSDLSPGAFLDLDGYVYTGYAHTFHFGSKVDSVANMFVVGVGPKLLQVLKAESAK